MSRLDHRLEPEGEVRRFEVINGAILHGPAIIGDRCRISDYCLLESHAAIGSRCIVGHGAEISGVQFDGSYLWHYCEIYGVVGQSVDEQQCHSVHTERMLEPRVIGRWVDQTDEPKLADLAEPTKFRRVDELPDTFSQRNVELRWNPDKPTSVAKGGNFRNVAELAHRQLLRQDDIPGRNGKPATNRKPIVTKKNKAQWKNAVIGSRSNDTNAANEPSPKTIPSNIAI